MTSKLVTYRIVLSDSQEWCVLAPSIADLDIEINKAAKQRGFKRNQITDVFPVTDEEEEAVLS